MVTLIFTSLLAIFSHVFAVYWHDKNLDFIFWVWIGVYVEKVQLLENYRALSLFWKVHLNDGKIMYTDSYIYDMLCNDSSS